MLEAVFSLWSVLRLHNEDQLPLQDSPEKAVRKIRGWCEIDASLRGRDLGSKGMSTVGRSYHAEQ
jgi:hypothetical protein